MKTNFLRMVLPILVATSAATGVILLFTSIPPVSEQLPPGGANLHIFLTTPQADALLPLNEEVMIEAGFTGDVTAMQAVEFWVDGMLFGTQAISPLPDLASASLAWIPDTVGVHVLQVRLLWSTGLVSSSDPVRVLVLASLPQGSITHMMEGDNEEWIVQINTRGGHLGMLRGGVDTEEPWDWIDVVAPSVEDVPNNESFWLHQRLGLDKIPPAGPLLEAEARRCDVHLYFLDQSTDEFGFFVYRTVPGESGLERIASLAANDQDLILEYIDPNQSGLLTYMVAAYNTAGESPSNPVNVAVFDPTCSGLDPQTWLEEAFQVTFVEVDPTGTPEATTIPGAILQEVITFTPELNTNCRSGPGADFPVLTQLSAAVVVPVEARSPDGTWLVVHSLEGLRCWAWADMGLLSGGIEELQVEEEPAHPVLITPTKTGVSAPTRTPCPPSHLCP